MNNLIDGRAVAAQLQGELAGRIAALKAQGVAPGLAFVPVAKDEMALVAGSSSPLAGRRNVRVRELNGMEFIFFDKADLGLQAISGGKSDSLPFLKCHFSF